MAEARPEAIALISGGKDSLLSLYHAIANGYNIVALGNLHPPITTATTSPLTSTTIDDGTGTTIHHPTALSAPSMLGAAAVTSDELDSYMYQTIGHTLLPLYAQCLNLPLYRRPIAGATVNTQLDYSPAATDETEDLTRLLHSIMVRHPRAVAVTSGAILSTYQRTRIESVCARLGLTSLAFLWQMQQEGVLRQLAALRFDARIVKVAALGLDERWLWENVANGKVMRKLDALNTKWGINVAGEGGEYETLVVSAPGWRGKIEAPEGAREVREEGGGAAWVAFKEARVEAVDGGEGVQQEDWVSGLETEKVFDQKSLELVAAVKRMLPTINTTSVPILIGVDEADEANDDDTPLSPSIFATATALYISNLVSPEVCTTVDAELSSIFAVLTSFLTPYSLSLTTITSVTLLLRDMSSFSTLNAHYSAFFPLPLPPSRVCVSVPHLPKHRNILLSATILLPSPRPRKGLHVQSRSYWAPANIGPYSQALLSTPWWDVAGQIPLIPATMQLQPGRIESCVLALQHLRRVWTAVGAHSKTVVVWVVEPDMVEAAIAVWEGELMVVMATGLPRGAGVEVVGIGSELEGGAQVEIVFGESVGDVVQALERLQALGKAQGMVTVYLAGSNGVQGFMREWGERRGVMIVPVRGVWDGEGRRWSVGCMIRSA